MDESEFENFPTGKSTDGVASDKKHASVTVVVPSSQTEASPSKVISQSSPDKKKRDRINSLEQKEENLSKAGVTRYKYMLRIAEALDATKKVEYRDAQGNVKYREEPDFEKNKWGAEMAAKLHGDLIERKEVEHDIGETTLSRFKAMSVAELKARALQILEGKNRIIDVNP